jgi:hypothetical protein
VHLNDGRERHLLIIKKIVPLLVEKFTLFFNGYYRCYTIVQLRRAASKPMAIIGLANYKKHNLGVADGMAGYWYPK